MKQPRRHTVEEVEHGAHDNPQQSHRGIAIESERNGDAPRNQVATRDCIGDMFLHEWRVLFKGAGDAKN